MVNDKILECDDISTSHNWKWAYGGVDFVKTLIPETQQAWRVVSQRVIGELVTEFELSFDEANKLWNNFHRLSHIEAAYKKGYADGQEAERSRRSNSSQGHDMERMSR